MIRRWVVEAEPDTGVVDRQRLVEAVLEGEAIQWRLGGVLTIMHNRQKTGFPGEALSTRAVIEWKDRVDARLSEERGPDVLDAVAAVEAVAEQPGVDIPPIPEPDPLVVVDDDGAPLEDWSALETAPA